MSAELANKPGWQAAAAAAATHSLVRPLSVTPPETPVTQADVASDCRRLSASKAPGGAAPEAGATTDDTAAFSESETDSAGASKPSSLPGSLDGKESDYTDTICSNRSDFFKRYYAAQISPAKVSPDVGTNGYRVLPQTDPMQKPTSPIAAQPTPADAPDKPAAKEEAARGWVSKCLNHIRFSWVAMTLLFIVIIASICVIVLEYNIHKSKYAFFGRFKFNEEERRLRLLSPETGAERARVFVAGMVANGDLPYDCGLLRSTRVSHTSKYLAESTSDGTGVCLEWKNAARVTIEHVRPERLNCSGRVCHGIECYRVDWRSLGESAGLMDCFSLTEPAGQLWFGSSETAAAAEQWPVGGAPLPLAPLVTGDVSRHTFGNVVQRYFISNQGVGVYVWNDEPLFQQVSNDRLCLANLRKPFPYRYPTSQLQMLYSVCTGPDIAALHRFGTHVINPYGEKIEATRRRVWPSFDQMVYHFPSGDNFTQDDVITYGDMVMNRKYGRSGALVLDRRWQAHQGDLTFDPHKFHNAWKAVEQLQRKGLELAVTISPLVELKSVNIEYGIDNNLWIREAISAAPALVNLPGGKGAWMDISSPSTRGWLLKKLKKLKEVTKVKWVVIEDTASQQLPFYYNLTSQMSNPDLLAESLHTLVRQAGLEVLSISSVIRPRADPVFAQLSSRPASWAGLQQVLPSVLSAATGGTHFVSPPVVGGTADGSTVDAELYARWLQLTCFLPRVQFALLPHQLSGATEHLANTLLWRRRQLVLPAYKTALRESLAAGWPLIRPLWHQFPDDVEAAPIGDQFLVGGDLLVAPVTQPNATTRRVYLPRGLWREVTSGRIDSGGRWITETVTSDAIPHYQLFRP